MQKLLMLVAGLGLALGTASGQKSPPKTATGKIGSAEVSIKYCAPSLHGRKVFAPDGPVMHDPTAPIWRAGANDATAFHTSGDLTIGSLAVPKGDYTLYVNVKDPDAWELIVNKQTGQWGTHYDAGMDLGRVKMEMSKPAAPLEMLKYTITSKGEKGALQLAWENHIATVPVEAK